MHKFAFCWGSAADPVGGALTPDGDLLTDFTGPTTKGTEGKGREGEKGKVKGKERRRGERRDLAHPKISAWRPLCFQSTTGIRIYASVCVCSEHLSSHKQLRGGLDVVSGIARSSNGRVIQAHWSPPINMLHRPLSHTIIKSCC